MQQHTGQHVLSAAFDRLFGVRTESFHMGQLSSTIDLAREVSAVGDREGRRRCESHRLGGSAGGDPLCDRGGSRGDAAAKGIGAHRIAAADRRAGLRPVGVRRHARRAHRRDRRDRDRRLGEVQGRIARRVPVRRPRAAAVPGLARRAVGDAEASVGAADRDGGVDRAHAGRRRRRCSATFAASRKSSRLTKRTRLLAQRLDR